jgi:polar amino acid transport system permease protein
MMPERYHESTASVYRIVRLRHWDRWVTAFVILTLLALLIDRLRFANIHYSDVPSFFRYSVMIEGMWHTVILAIACQSLGIVLGIAVAILRSSRNPVASYAAWLYIWIFRGVPALLQLLIWYNLALAFPTLGIPGIVSVSTNTVMSPFVAALLGLGLNESAYYAEIVRAGFNSVDVGQVEAAYSLGMTPGKTMRRVILPQALRVIIPPTGNDFINMLKETSLASVISYLELLQAASNIYSHNLEVMEALLAAAIWYMILITTASVGQYYLEQSVRGGRDTRPPTPLRERLVAVLTSLPFSRPSAPLGSAGPS